MSPTAFHQYILVTAVEIYESFPILSARGALSRDKSGI